jgi:hypothetical protein
MVLFFRKRLRPLIGLVAVVTTLAGGIAISGALATDAAAAVPNYPCVWYTPAASIQKNIQQGLTDRGLYNGMVDGDWGPLSRSAIQKAIARWEGYTGRTDGVYAGTDTCVYVQRFARDFGKYAGPVDGELGPHSWNGFMEGIWATGGFTIPTASLQQAVQIQLTRLGLYNGVQDGEWGPVSATAIQKAVAKYAGYHGIIDGTPGPLTSGYVQIFAIRGGYVGPVNGSLTELAWVDFWIGLLFTP